MIYHWDNVETLRHYSAGHVIVDAECLKDARIVATKEFLQWLKGNRDWMCDDLENHKDDIQDLIDNFSDDIKKLPKSQQMAIIIEGGE